MKTEIIAMLAFPRKMMGGNIPLETCEHAGNFLPSDNGCLVCETRLECEWLYRNDESAALTDKPLDIVADALGSAVLYVDACVTRAGHDARACHCQACDWLRRARRLHETTEQVPE
jgi:hypothetical protein